MSMGTAHPTITTELAIFSRTDYSDASPLATQRRYQMPHRSPIIFWLLLAATLVLDVVAVCGLFETGLGGVNAIALFLSVAYGQLSLLCVWAVVERKSMKTRWLVPIGAALVASFVMTLADTSDRGRLDLETLLTITCIFLLHVGPLLVLFWFVIPTAWISPRAGLEGRRRQFSTFQLLILMTGVAIFLSALRATHRFEGEWINIATFCLANVILLIGMLTLLQMRWPVPLRIAACMSLAISISAIANWTKFALADQLNVWIFFIVQGVVLTAWLTMWLPARGTSNVDPESMLPLGIA
jgi:hypothetical protein